MNRLHLASYINQMVRLRFRDGEIVDALLLGADEDRHQDLTYEVREVLTPGNPRPRGTRPGGTCIASLEELSSWEPVNPE